MKPGWEWNLLRWSWTVFWILEIAIITVIDYPRGAPIWDAMTGCSVSAGWIHEVFYMFVGWAVVLDLTYYWQKRGQDTRVFIVRSDRLEKDKEKV